MKLLLLLYVACVCLLRITNQSHTEVKGWRKCQELTRCKNRRRKKTSRNQIRFHTETERGKTRRKVRVRVRGKARCGK